MKDIRMPTPFTTSNAEETGMGTNKHCTVAKERKEERERERRRRERDRGLKVSHETHS